MMRPLLAAINAEGLDYTGVIYVVCMPVGDQLYGTFDRQPPLTITDDCFVNLVATQGPPQGAQQVLSGWPYGGFGRGYPIAGLDAVDRDRCLVFYGAARTRVDGQLVTDGGKCVNLVGSRRDAR